MMMKHRIFLLLLVLSLMCGLCACTAAPTDTGASAQTDELSDAQETTASSVSDGTETFSLQMKPPPSPAAAVKRMGRR